MSNTPDGSKINISASAGVVVGDGTVQHIHIHSQQTDSLLGLDQLKRVVAHQFGVIPPEAGFFQRRDVTAYLNHTFVVDDTTTTPAQILAGMGGTGKTQVAAAAARHLRDSGFLRILVWVTATSRETVISAYAAAALDLIPGADPTDPENAAQALLIYLGTVRGQWLVVLDDVTNPAHLNGLWPPKAPTGRLIITTRRTDAALEGRGIMVTVHQYTPAEAEAYLTAAFQAHPARHEGAAELAYDLGYLPLALAQATAYINDRGITCNQYRTRFAERERTIAQLMPDSLPDDHTRSIAVTLDISIDAADQIRPQGMARNLLQVLSMLDPNGVQRSFVTAPATLDYLRRHGPSGISDADLGDALHCLTRLSLITLAEDASLVYIHALVQPRVNPSGVRSSR